MSLPCYRFDSVDSTLLEAKRIRTTVKGPFTVVSRVQTGGVGRLGRAWSSPPGGLWYTLAWPAALPLPRYGALPLVAGLAVVDAIEPFLADSMAHSAIKWPNDVLLNDAKVAGILCQSATDAAGLVFYIGIGINVNFSHDALPRDLRHPATTIAQENGSPIEPESLVGPLTDRLAQLLPLLEREGFAPLLPELQARLAWLHQQVTAEVDGEGSISGELCGVSPEGHLLLATAREIREVTSGEVRRLRPV